MAVDKNNIIADKTFEFAVRIGNLYKYLRYKAENKEYVFSKQLLRSGSSIGANVEEALGAISKADFVNKLAIAYKEARESRYWIRLLYRTEYLTTEQYDSLMTDLEEICRIIAKIQISTKNSINKD